MAQNECHGVRRILLVRCTSEVMGVRSPFLALSPCAALLLGAEESPHSISLKNGSQGLSASSRFLEIGYSGGEGALPFGIPHGTSGRPMTAPAHTHSRRHTLAQVRSPCNLRRNELHSGIPKLCLHKLCRAPSCHRTLQIKNKRRMGYSTQHVGSVRLESTS